MIEINNEAEVNSVLFVEDGKQVLSGDDGGVLRWWQVDDGHEITGQATKVKGREVYAAALSPDREWLVCGLSKSKGSNEKARVAVLNAKTHEIVLNIDAHKDTVGSVDVSWDSKRFATGGWDDRAFVWDLVTGQRLLGPLQHDSDVVAIRFSPKADRFATADQKLIRVFGSDNGQLLLSISSSFRENLSSPLTWSTDGRRLFAASCNEARCFDASTGSSIKKWPIPGSSSLASIALSSNEKFLAVVANTTLSFWDTSTYMQIGRSIAHDSTVWSIALSPNDEYIVTGERRGKITVRNLRDVLPSSYFQEMFANLKGHVLLPLDLCVSIYQLPIMKISGTILNWWMQGDLTRVVHLLREGIRNPSNTHRFAHSIALRALLHSLSKEYELAIENAEHSLTVEYTVLGHIVKAISLAGKGDQEMAMQAFDLVFRDCDPKVDDCKFLLLIKAIIMFGSGNEVFAVSRVHDLIATADNDAKYCYLQVLGNMYLKQGDYERAVESLDRSQKTAPSSSNSFLTVISLMFGWSFDGLDITIQKKSCEALLSTGRILEATKALLNIKSVLDKVVESNKVLDDWINDFTQKCAEKLGILGDEALVAKKYDDAISQYTGALSLDPPHRAVLLVKRSKAHSEKGLWTDALEDANEATHLEVSYPWGHEAKHVAFLGLKRNDEAIEAFRDMLFAIENSPDEETREIRKRYVSPSKVESAIDNIIRGVLMISPLVLIDVETGRLCDGSERIRIFKSEAVYKELILSMTKEIDEARILHEVAKYFRYVTLSHVWQGREPSFQQVELAESIKNLDLSPLNDKLRKFCEVVRGEGYRWAWSDTCCIDKTISTVLNESITLMYMWYKESAATLIYLANVASPSSLGDLTESKWLTRAWTLQELLVPKVIRFYDQDWKRYLDDQRINHKDSPEIMGELAKAINVSVETIIAFHPDNLGIREKLRLASNRDATREEDIAYSLIGILKSDIKPNYGDREKALGQLLEEIVTRSGDVAVLAWTGKSSPYNSCLPATLSVYSEPPHTPPAIDDAEMEECVTTLKRTLTSADAILVHDRVTRLSPARFANRRLYLPCIIFPIKRLGAQKILNGQEIQYRARVSGIGYVEFQTSDRLSLTEPRKLILVHPWIRDLRDPLDGLGWGDASDDESDTDSDSERGSGIGSSTPMQAVPVAKVDRYTRALRLVVRLQRPFHALLLQQQPNGEFRRVAAEHEIVAPGLDRRIDIVKDVLFEVVEVL